jgi:hypothetical protein
VRVEEGRRGLGGQRWRRPLHEDGGGRREEGVKKMDEGWRDTANHFLHTLAV